jgi:hypothetical protein
MRDAMHDVANEPGQRIEPGSASIGFAFAIEKVRQREPIDFDGASGPIEFDANGDNTRTLASFWRFDGAAIKFVRERVMLLDVTTGLTTDMPCLDTLEEDDFVCE